VVADTLSQTVEEIEQDDEWLLGFETTEFETDDYVELRKDMESNKKHLPDIKVVEFHGAGFIF